MNVSRAVVSLLLGLFVLWRNLPGALLCVWPALIRSRPEREESPEVDGPLFSAMEAELAPLGFRRLGVHLEQPPLKPAVLVYDFVNERDAAYASAFFQGEDARLYLVTPLDAGGFVLTADYKRPGTEREGHFLSGGVPNAEPEQLLAVHRRRVERLRSAGREPRVVPEMSARLAVANAWYRGAGSTEVRWRHMNNLLLGLVGVFIVAAVVVGVIRSRL